MFFNRGYIEELVRWGMEDVINNSNFFSFYYFDLISLSWSFLLILFKVF